MRTFNAAPFCHRGWHSYKCHYTYPVAYFQGCATSINSWGPMDDIFVTQPFTARHVRFTKKLGFGSLGKCILSWNWKYWKVPLHLLVKWGRWFLQIVDIHVGNLNMKLTGRWFPQIVDRDSGNLYPIYIYITKIVVLVSEPVRGRSRATELPCYPDFDLFHTSTHLNSPGSIQHMQPYLAQHTNSIHSQRVMSGTQLWLSKPIPK